ncbi:ATP-binding protein [Thalassotalea euphylliae]|uniref:GAF domain-containing sensor histidine kinase n=1 Tax=Thalassotalea euphylliae TaxID=1655234 RepID=UPI0036330379
MSTSLQFNPVEKDAGYWQKAIELEEGRCEVLRLVASGESLEAVLALLCQKAQLYNPELLCSVLRLDSAKGTLHPIASVSLPQFYCDALEGVEIGLGVGSCGTSAFTKKRTIVEDIGTHPYWVQYKELAHSAGLHACWSEPIIGREGQVFGTFAIYYAYPKAPTEEDLKFIEVSANLAAVVFDNHLNRQQLMDANRLLSQTVDERTAALSKANEELALLIERQEEKHIAKLGIEKSVTANALLSGFAHEISTPIGTALMSISTAQEKLEQLVKLFDTGKLSRRVFESSAEELSTLVAFNRRALDKADELLNQFKKVQADKMDAQREHFNLSVFLTSMKNALVSTLKSHELVIESADIDICCDKESLWQVLFQLIDNAIIHGFKDIERGCIHITTSLVDNHVVLNIQDNGKGVQEDQANKLFDPFYTTSLKHKNMGLGLTTVYNLLANVLNGTIHLKPSPVGVRFEIKIPIGI